MRREPSAHGFFEDPDEAIREETLRECGRVVLWSRAVD